jgi:hypothetical protein
VTGKIKVEMLDKKVEKYNILYSFLESWKLKALVPFRVLGFPPSLGCLLNERKQGNWRGEWERKLLLRFWIRKWISTIVFTCSHICQTESPQTNIKIEQINHIWKVGKTIGHYRGWIIWQTYAEKPHVFSCYEQSQNPLIYRKETKK